MLNVYLATIGLITALLVFVSKKIHHWPVSEPLVATAFGVLLGPRALGWIELQEPQQWTVLLEASRILLAVSLVGIALRYPLADVRKRTGRTVLLLVVVMPGMAIVSAVLGWWLLGLSLPLAWLLGACVSPTDPVLASSVVTGDPATKLVPGRLRQLLSVESGSNDGLAFPLVVLGIVLVEGESFSRFAWTSLWGVLGAVGIGVGVGALAGIGMRWAQRDRDVEETVGLLFAVVLALFTLGVGKLANTDAILGVLAAGLAYNHGVSSGERAAENSVDEALNRFVVLPLFVLLGIALPWTTWADMGWPVLAFAVTVLLLRRPPLIAAIRRPLDFHWPATVFYGWFGPIGASALYYVMHAHHQGVEDPRLFGAASLVIVLSVVAHGSTATIGRVQYARRADTDAVSMRT